MVIEISLADRTRRNKTVMKKTILIGLVMSLTGIQSVFAQDLGVLTLDSQPQNLLSGADLSSQLDGGIGVGASELRWGAFHRARMHSRNSFWGNPWRRHWIDSSSSSNLNQDTTNNSNLAQRNVGCFASNSLGHWFVGDATTVTDVRKAQEDANLECGASGHECLQNLGCTVTDN